MPGDPAATAPPPARPRVLVTTTAWVWLGVAAAAGAAGWYKSINLFVLAAYVLVALFGVNAWLAWRSASRLTGRRTDPGPVFPGEPAVVHAEVTNPSARPVTAVVSGQAGGQRAAWLLAPLGPGQTLPVVARWSFDARGRHPMPPLEVDGAYPFGLIHVVRPITAAGEVRVLPPVGRVDLTMFRRWLIRGGSGGDARSRRPSRRPSAELGDVSGLRAYRPGDSPRDVHWKSSARRGQLLVREYDHAEPLDLRLVIDPWLPADAGPGSAAARRLEWALSLAATLVKAWCEADELADVLLVVAGSPAVVRGGRASTALLRDTLAPLAGLSGVAAVPAVPADAVRGRANRTVRLVLSPRPDGPVLDAVRRVGGPVAAVDATAPPAWFTPPPGLAAPAAQPR